jgi:hypothetical protein
MNTGLNPALDGEMEPVISVILRRFDHQIRQLDRAMEIDATPLRRVYRVRGEELATITIHRDLFRLRTGNTPAWEARVRNPDEALAGLARVLDFYWQLIYRKGSDSCSNG